MNIIRTLWDKFNWGTGIFLVYSAFVIFMLSLVYMSTQQKLDLVTENYYSKGVNFQSQINEQSNVAALTQKPTIKQLENGNIELQFSDTEKNVQGQIAFFRPSDKDLDFIVPIQLQTQNSQIITQKIEQGLWRVKLSWSEKGKNFYQETVLVASN